MHMCEEQSRSADVTIIKAMQANAAHVLSHGWTHFMQWRPKLHNAMTWLADAWFAEAQLLCCASDCAA